MSSSLRKQLSCCVAPKRCDGPKADFHHFRTAKALRRQPNRPSAAYRLNSVSLARAAPCVREFSFAQAICGCERPPNPQSQPAMTFSGPTRCVNLRMRCATSSGCSTTSVECVTTPGTMILPCRKLHVVPDDELVFVARIRRLEKIGLRAHGQHDVHHVAHLDVVRVRAVPAAPAQVVAHAVLRNVAKRMIEGVDAKQRALPERRQAHLQADAIPQGRQPRVVDLQDEAGRRDHLVFDTQGFREGEDELFLRRVVLVAPVGLEAGRRRRGQEAFLPRLQVALEQLDLALRRGLSLVGDRAGADPVLPLRLDVFRRRIEQRALRRRVGIEVREGLAVLALQDDRGAGGSRGSKPVNRSSTYESQSPALAYSPSLITSRRASRCRATTSATPAATCCG